MAGKITALPSVVTFSDGRTRELSSLDENERKQFNERLCRSISEAMSDYYAYNRNDWDDLCGKIGSPVEKQRDTDN